MVSTTGGSRSPKSSMPIYGPHVEVPENWTGGALFLRIRVLPEGNTPGRGMSQGVWVQKPRSGWATLVQQARPAPHSTWHCSRCKMHICPDPRVSCQRICAEEDLSRENISGRSNRTTWGFLKCQQDCTGVESPFCQKWELQWERIGCTLKLARDVNGTLRFQPLRLGCQSTMSLCIINWSIDRAKII